MKKTAIVLTALLLVITSSSSASNFGVSGKNGETCQINPTTLAATASSVRAVVEYNTAGAIDTPATQGGDREGWGTEFITRWDNNTGQDIVLEEFGWPCGGWWSNFWYVWITSELPEDPYTLQFYGSFVAASEDDLEYPPSLYTYIDVSEEGILIPAGASMYFGYGNPGMAGQVLGSSAATYSWYEEMWDNDNAYNRTTILQFKGNPYVVPVDAVSFGSVKALFR